MKKFFYPVLYHAKKDPGSKPIGRTMKLTASFLLVCSCFAFAGPANSQNTKISLNKNQIQLGELLDEIEEQTDYLFISNRNVDLTRKVSVRAADKPVREVLEEALRNTGLTFRIEGVNIILSEERARTAPRASQQAREINGKIVDANGEPVIGANVIEKGTGNGTVSDIDGNFSLSVAAGATLSVSYIGYLEQEITIREGQTRLLVKLQEDTQRLDEVVVVGYGTVRKRDLTGAVTSVSDSQFDAQPVKKMSEILQGRVAGVQASSYSGGQLGTDANIRIRGVSSINFGNDPLWVIDGVFGGPASITNPDDIASIEILKDASSTAIYGSRGANGVILVTTKRGQAGKPHVSVSGEIGISNIPKRLDQLSAYEYAQALEAMTDTRFSEEEMNGYRTGALGLDWQDLIFQTGVSQDYKLNISGGSEKNRYFVSGLFLNQTGVTEESKLKRYGFRANLDSDVTNWLNITTNIEGSVETTHNTAANLMDMANYSPTMELTDENGVYQRDPYSSQNASPYGLLKARDTDAERYNVNGYVDLKFKIIDGLTFSALGSMALTNGSNYYFTSTKAWPSAISGMSNSMNRTVTLQNTNNLTYQKQFGDHSLTATGVFEIYQKEYKTVGVSGNDLLSEKVGYWNVSAVQSGLSGSTSYTKEQMVSAFGRVMYNYKNRYYATATLRADGASKFINNKWGYFPSGALAWNVSEEEFMKEQDLFQQLKLRASVGATGNQAIGTYGTLGLLTLANYTYGMETLYPGFWLNTYASPDLTWEKTYSFDVGVDATLLDQRLSLTIDWYRKNTKDLLFQKSIPMFYGGGSYWDNVGEMYSTGVELSATAYPVRTKDFEWQTILTASSLKTEVTNLGGEEFLIPDAGRNNGLIEDVYYMEEGLPISNFHLWEWAGIDDNGANLYRTKDGGVTTSPSDEDRVVTGNPIPKWNFGWNNTLRYKNWEMNIFFRGSTGFQRLNMVRMSTSTMNAFGRFITSRDGYYNSWDVVADKSRAEFASSKNSESRVLSRSTQWLEDADFLRLQNVSISYLFPRKQTRFADVSIGFSAQNLFTITKYKGMDPETSESTSDTEVGLDMGNYPSTRTFTFTLKLGF